MLNSRKKSAVKSVIRGLNKASRTHAGQAKKLKKVINSPNGKKRRK